MTKRIIAFAVAIVFLSLSLCGCASQPNTALPPAAPHGAPTPLTGLLDPDSEIRGVWIATVYNIDFPSAPDLSADELAAEIDSIIDTCKRLNLNTVFFQVRPSFDALYDSDIFPVSRFLSSTGELTLDPLSYLLSEAHKNEIFVFAWVNPLRISTAYSSEPALPAGVTDGMTVEYDGKLVLNAGVPESRDLVARGVGEIVEKYDVDGVVFDDYFYPYPVNDESGRRIPFDDGDAYLKYGGDADLADFRRQSVNDLVKACRDAVKAADPECVFGVSPFGVWRNAESDGGAGTAGFEAYDELYCDAVAWVRGGYVDFLCPQIYWKRSAVGTPYGLLADWWNAILGAGGTDLLISHAAYRYEEGDWDDPEGEIKAQIEYARGLMAYRGSVLYGYDEIKSGIAGIDGEVRSAYENEIVYLDPVSDGSGITVTSHDNYSGAGIGKVTLSGHSDPSLPLFINGDPVGRLKNGDFSVTVNIKAGENRFLFTQRGEELLFILYG